MSNATFIAGRAELVNEPADDKSASLLDRAPAAFGISAAVAIVFNTVLAWVKDAYDPLNAAMAAMTGHHWITHSLADLAVFLLLGCLLLAFGVRVEGRRLARLLSAACLLGGGGLALWFLIV
jgi:hypothetical protein